MTAFVANPERYADMSYRHSGCSGLKLPAVSLGLWHNFGGVDALDSGRQIVRTAFDQGITHFDLANNYGPPPGSAESTLGALLRTDLAAHRDELVISTKAGYTMWPGPYGDWGSRKTMIASLDQSLGRMGIDYVDIFYHHRPDPHTPLEETMAALAFAVSSGRALYVGLSNYPAPLLTQAAALLRALGTPCLIHQSCYNMLDRSLEAELLPALQAQGIGCIAFSPLAQGVLTDRYLTGIIPPDSRAAGTVGFLRPDNLTAAKIGLARALDKLAKECGQTLAQFALGWVLRHPGMTSVLIGASRSSQVMDAANALAAPAFTNDLLAEVDRLLSSVNGKHEQFNVA